MLNEEPSEHNMVAAYVKLVGTGNVTLTTTINYKEQTYTDSYDFFVKEQAESFWKMEMSGKNEIEVNETTQLKAELRFYFEPAIDVTKEGAKWISSDENIAKVNNEGLVTGIAPGRTTISASYVVTNNEDEQETITGNYEVIVKGNEEPDNPTPTPSPNPSLSPNPTPTPSISPAPTLTQSPKPTIDPTVAKKDIPKTGEDKLLIVLIIVANCCLIVLMYSIYKKNKWL